MAQGILPPGLLLGVPSSSINRCRGLVWESRVGETSATTNAAESASASVLATVSLADSRNILHVVAKQWG